jgi:hypothetical protein
MSYNKSLSSDSNYPPMSQSQWDSAPFNEEEVPEKEFDVTCTLCMSKTVSCYTKDYIPGAEGVDYEPDDEGGSYAVPYHEDDNTSDTNWSEVFKDNHKTIPELLEEFKQYLQKDIKNIDAVAEIRKHDKAFLKRKLERLIEECDGWSIDEEDYEKD